MAPSIGQWLSASIGWPFVVLVAVFTQVLVPVFVIFNADYFNIIRLSFWQMRWAHGLGEALRDLFTSVGALLIVVASLLATVGSMLGRPFPRWLGILFLVAAPVFVFWTFIGVVATIGAGVGMPRTPRWARPVLWILGFLTPLTWTVWIPNALGERTRKRRLAESVARQHKVIYPTGVTRRVGPPPGAPPRPVVPPERLVPRPRYDGSRWTHRRKP